MAILNKDTLYIGMQLSWNLHSQWFKKNDYHCYSLDKTIKMINGAINNNEQLSNNIDTQLLSKIIGSFVTDKKYIYFKCIANCNKSIKFKHSDQSIFYGNYTLMPKYIQHLSYVNPFEEIYRNEQINETNIISFFWTQIPDCNDSPWMAVSHAGDYVILNNINQQIYSEIYNSFYKQKISPSNLTLLDGPVCSPKCFANTVFGTKAFDSIGRNIAKEYLLFSVKTKLQIPLLIQYLIAKYVHLYNNW